MSVIGPRPQLVRDMVFMTPEQRIRSQKQRDNVVIMSFDRLHAMSGYQQFTCSEVSRGKYNILHIPPTFRYRADRVEILAKYENFEKAIDSMEKTSSERKEFLHKRFSYWITKLKKAEMASIQKNCGSTAGRRVKVWRGVRYFWRWAI